MNLKLAMVSVMLLTLIPLMVQAGLAMGSLFANGKQSAAAKQASRWLTLTGGILWTITATLWILWMCSRMK